MTASRRLIGARLVAWACFLFGTVVSVGFNVLAAFLIPADEAAGWRPDVWTILGAAVWPLALLGSIELLARVPWPDNLLAKVIRYGAMSVVALFAAAISYQHIRSVLLAWRYNELSSGVGPLVIDGLMVLAGYAMVVISAVLAIRQGGPLPEPKQGPVVAPEPTSDSQQNPGSLAAQQQAQAKHAAQADWERSIIGLGKPITVPLPQPQDETPVNGRRPVSAAVKTRASTRAAAGPTVGQIVEQILARLDGSPDFTVTKREIQETYSVGSGKANDALKQAREAFEARQREEQA